LDALGDKFGNLEGLAGDINGEVGYSGCTSFSCSGSAASCYLARKRWEDGCGIYGAVDEFNVASQEFTQGLDTYNKQFVDENGAYNEIYKVSDTKVGELLKSYDETNGLNFDGSCPQPRHYNAGLFSFDINLQPFCDMALIIRACIMAAAAFGSFMMISKFI
jgi:hypothetical protein